MERISEITDDEMELLQNEAIDLTGKLERLINGIVLAKGFDKIQEANLQISIVVKGPSRTSNTENLQFRLPEMNDFLSEFPVLLRERFGTEVVEMAVYFGQEKVTNVIRFVPAFFAKRGLPGYVDQKLNVIQIFGLDENKRGQIYRADGSASGAMTNSSVVFVRPSQIPAPAGTVEPKLARVERRYITAPPPPIKTMENDEDDEYADIPNEIFNFNQLTDNKNDGAALLISQNFYKNGIRTPRDFIKRLGKRKISKSDFDDFFWQLNQTNPDIVRLHLSISERLQKSILLFFTLRGYLEADFAL